MNKVILMGRLTKDPEIRATATGMQVASFTLAVNRRFAKEEPKADFFNITAWNKTAEFVCKYFTKGQQVLVSGRLENRSWEDNSGVKRYATDVIAEEVEFADSKKQEDKEETKGDWQPMHETLTDADLPF
jgi:single-strand DNA-binding protein